MPLYNFLSQEYICLNLKKTIFQYKGNIMIKTLWSNWEVNIENNWLICYWQNRYRKSWKGHSNYQSYILWSSKHVELVVYDISKVMKCVIDKTQTMAWLHLPTKQRYTMRPLQLPLSLFFFLFPFFYYIHISLTKICTAMYIYTFS